MEQQQHKKTQHWPAEEPASDMQVPVQCWRALGMYVLTTSYVPQAPVLTDPNLDSFVQDEN
jgi:hypothetical protein